VRRPSQPSRAVSSGMADVGRPRLLVSPGSRCLPRFRQLHPVAFTNPFTRQSVDLSRLNLSHPPHSCRPLAGGNGSRLAKRPRSGMALTRRLRPRSSKARRARHQLGRQRTTVRRAAADQVRTTLATVAWSARVPRHGSSRVRIMRVPHWHSSELPQLIPGACDDTSAGLSLEGTQLSGRPPRDEIRTVEARA